MGTGRTRPLVPALLVLPLLFQSLPADERAALLESYGLSPETSVAPERDVSAPETVAPREQPPTDIELAGSVEGETPPQPDRVPDPLADGALEIRRAFEGFLAESRPVEIDQDLEQFGYDLFAGAPSTFAPATDIPVSSDYIIGPGDEVLVQLYGKTNAATTLVVDRDGVVSFPELGPVSVAGLTFREMKEHIAREVDNRMIGTSVSVSMGRLRSIRVFVLGDVFRPGSYTVSGLSTLTNALFASGGVQKIGSLRRVQLKRGGETIQTLDLYDLLIRGDTSDDVRLMPGDVIFVPTVGSLVGVAGEVLRPAIYEMNGMMTVRQLIDLAGGMRPTADAELIQLDRIEAGRRVTYDLSLRETSGWDLAPGDLVKIYPVAGGDDLAVFLEGNVLRPGRREFTGGMRLLDVIDSTEDLLPETFFEYGLIERESELNREPEYVAFNLRAALLDSIPVANVPLAARDKIFVFHRGHFRDVPSVTIRGEVRSPGTYELKKDMRVLDLVLAAGGLTRDAWLHEAELFRTDARTMEATILPISMHAVLAANTTANVVLQNMDELAVHSLWEFRQAHTVQVNGEVNTPGTYPLTRGMRVSDLIFAGGNLKEKAYRQEAELTRYEVVDGERRELHHVTVDLAALLAGSEEADLPLRPYDRLLIRRITNWRVEEVVQVSGEVAFPGDYPIEEGERLSKLVERFGGFLDDAYLPAAVLQRTAIKELQAEQLERMADQLDADLARLSVPSSRTMSATELSRRQAALESGAQLAEKLRQTEATGRMVIDIGPAEDLRGSDRDLLLTDGDRLHIPKRPDFVMVMGQVNNPTAFQFQSRKNAGHFISLAGGITEFGDRGGVYVVKADGSVEMGRRTRIDPGDVVVVPEQLERFDGMQFLLDISQVLYQIGLAAASAYTVGLFD